MKNIFLIILIFASFINNLSAQSENKDDNLYFKDGTLFGKKSDLVNACASKIKDRYSKEFNNQYNYCGCFLALIAKYYTYDDFKIVLNNKKDFIPELIKNGNHEVLNELKLCGNYLIETIDSNYDLTTLDNNFDKIFITGCLYDVNNTVGINKKIFDSNIYCECLKDEFVKQGLKVSEIKDFKDTNSVIYNEIILKCANNANILRKDVSLIISNDIVSKSKYEFIPIINNGSLNKVKVSIGSISKYFIIDSGATNISISSNFERELLLEGLLKKENYLNDENFILADGSVITCKTIIMNNVSIGSFIVNNVKISVINGNEGDLLLGKSFLNKFKKWTLDNANSKLYLETD